MPHLPDMRALNAEILLAHESADGVALARLYGKAAEALDQSGREDAACFYYTQAYVFALENGHRDADGFASALRRRGRL